MKKKPSLQKRKPSLQKRIEQAENLLAEHEDRLAGIAARIEWMQIQQAEQAPPQRTAREQRRYLNGSWVQRDGDTYPADHDRTASPYESWWRRSPPATE